jgi:hypothetical protein
LIIGVGTWQGARIAKQQLWDAKASTNHSTRKGRFDGLTVTAADRKDTTWWVCSFCDYKIKWRCSPFGFETRPFEKHPWS